MDEDACTVKCVQESEEGQDEYGDENEEEDELLECYDSCIEQGMDEDACTVSCTQ